MIDYDEACRRATTAQGLDPMTERLTAEGIDHYVDQTGGFTMVITVPLPGGGSAANTFGITMDGPEEEERRWLLCYYDLDDEDGTGTPIRGRDPMRRTLLTADEVVANVKNVIAQADA